jgi:ribose transport system permease protein
MSDATSAPGDRTSTAATPADGQARKPGRRGVGEIAEAYALVLLLLAVVAFFMLLPASSESFGSLANLKIVLGDQSVLLVICLAILFPIVTNSWDFTPGASAGLAAIFAASVVSSTGSILLALAAALATGMVIGAINGFLVTKARIDSVIATLGMTIVIAGVVQWKTDGSALLEGIPHSLTQLNSETISEVPILALIALALAVVSYYLLKHTIYGRDLYSIGSNRSAARLVGLRPERFVMSTYLISGFLGGAAGMVLLARTGAGNPSVGPGYLLPGYAAVYLGGTAITPGRWNVWGVVVAVLFLGALNSGLTLAGAESYVNNFANGIALFVGVGVASLLARKRGRTA